MKKQTKKYLTIGLISTISILLVLFLVIALFPGYKSTNYFNDGELGLVKYTISEQNFVQKWLLNTPKQAFFSTTTTTLGKSVTVSDYLPVNFNDATSKANIVSADLYISISGSSSLYKSILSNIPSGVLNPRIDISYTPQKVGDYRAYTVITFKNGETLRTDQNFIMKVTTPETACTKKPYFGDWSTIKKIDGGVIQSRKFYSVTSDCDFKLSSEEDRISCNEGFVVSGTSSSIAVYTGVQKCEATAVPPKTECDADVTETCSDGTVIVNQKCSSGILVSTENACSVVEIPETEDPVNQTTPVNQTSPQIEDKDQQLSFFDKYETQIMYSGITIIVLLVLLILYNLIRKK